MPKSTSLSQPAFLLMLAAAGPIAVSNPLSILWTGPAILLASMMIAWGAESAQFFMAQGFALVILAWMQTLPEFAVEAVLAWHQRTELLIANLTGAIRLLTGLGWPLIYATAAVSYRRKFGKPLSAIQLESHHSVQVVGVAICLLYVAVITGKGSLGLVDAVVLLAIYGAYVWLLRQLPAEEPESVEELGRVPHAVVTARPLARNVAIAALFVGGGGLIFFAADPFVGSLFGISSALGVSQFIFIQWVAPFVSEFPEQVSAFYWARSIDRAPLALMNMVSSNITQWTVLAAMLPVVLSLSRHGAAVLVFDPRQNVEMMMTLGQSLLGVLFLLSMRLTWWEAAGLFALWAVQFGLSLVAPGPGIWGAIAGGIQAWTTDAYFVWAAVETVRLVARWRRPGAMVAFARIWREEVRG